MTQTPLPRDADHTIQVLFEISNAVANAVDLQGLYRGIHFSLKKIFNADNIAIALYHPDKDSLTFPYFVDEMDEDFGEILDLSKKNSLAGTVIKTKKALLIRGDTLDRKRGPEGGIGTPCKVWVGSPLRIRDRILGVLVLQSYKDRETYQESDLDILNTISDFIAMAIERKQAEEEIRESEKLTATLFKIANAVNTAEDLSDLYQTIHRSLGTIINLTNFIIGLYDAREKTITFEYYVDEFDDLMGQSLPLASGSIGSDVIDTGQPLFLDQDGVTERMIKNQVVGTWPKTWLGVPLKVQGRVIGYMAAQSYSDPGLFTQGDVNLFSAVSDQVALAIDRKRSQEEARQNEKRTSTLFKISNAVNTTANLNDLYASIHRSLQDVMEVRNFAIGIYDRDTDTITYPYYVDETGEIFSQIRQVTESGINAGEVIRLKAPIFLTKDQILEKARKTGKDIVGTLSEQWLGVPLNIRDQVIGVVVVQHYDDPDYYTQKDMDLLTAVSDQIALAIDRKKAQEEIKVSERLTQTLFKISNAVNTTDNLDELYFAIFNTLNRLIALPNFFICLLDRPNKKIHFPFYIDEYDSEQTISFTADYHPDRSSTITTEVINTKEPLFLDCDRLKEKGEQGKIVGQVPLVWLGVPLIVRDKVIGVMAVQHYHDPEYFSQKDMDLLVAVSDQVALALDRKQAQEALLDHKSNLENRVQERTRKLTEEIQERIQIEKRLKRAKIQAEAAARAKLEFLTNMSHEIRTPINGIMGMTELALEMETSAELSELLGIIDHESKLLLGIINDILDFSKIDAGKLELNIETFNLRQAFERIAAFLSVGITPRQIKFNSRISPDVPDHVIGDPGRLRQILINLAANAIKFTRQGSVSMTCDRQGETRDSIELKFTIEDTGIGIPMEKQARIFDSFSQADGTTTREYGGTGLGTTISKQLVELMGGTIDFESTPGRGSTFWFTIPFPLPANHALPGAPAPPAQTDHSAPLPEAPYPPAPDRDAPSRLAVILLAEDYPTNQKIARQFLEGAGYQTVLAANGRQAVDTFQNQHIDLILMDIQMPVLDGYQATRRIREIEQTTQADRTPIIAMTAHALRGYREKCLAAGMDDYLTKPFRKQSFLAMVDKWTGSGGDPFQDELDLGHDSLSDKSDVFDLDLALEEFDMDREFLQEVMHEFLETVTGQLPRIRSAVQDKDSDLIAKEAHAIKGGAANLRAADLSKLAHALEKIGTAKDLNAAAPALTRLETAFNRFKTRLSALDLL